MDQLPLSERRVQLSWTSACILKTVVIVLHEMNHFELNVWVLKAFGVPTCLPVGNGFLGKQLLLCLSRCVDTSLERNSEKNSNAGVGSLLLHKKPETGNFSATITPIGLL